MICFGLTEISDINSVNLNSGDYSSDWGTCAGNAYGSMHPNGLIDFVCPCTPCDVQCTKCSGPSYTECSACNTGFYLQPTSTSCLNTCPTGHWKDDTNHICAECHFACSNCADGTDTQCSACNPGYFLQGSTCTACHSACSACTGSFNTQCSACKINYYLQPAPSDTTCDSTCPDGYWGDDATQSCQVCHSFCSECSGPNSNECSACKSGYFLQPNSTTCENCDISCAICSSSDNTQCSEGNQVIFYNPPQRPAYPLVQPTTIRILR